LKHPFFWLALLLALFWNRETAAQSYILRYVDTTSGAVTFTMDSTGRRTLAAAAPGREAPPMPPRIQETLSALGNGSAKHGLLCISQHPRLKGWEEGTGDPAGRAERIERQWTRCYRLARR